MPLLRICPECGAAILPGSTDGICVQCLFSLGLQPPDAPTPVLTSLDLSPRPPKVRPAAGVKFHYLGDYELLEELARGGMGMVFRARQISLNRIVALKLITAGHLATAEAVNRFHLEAEAAARLDHPNIVPIYEIGEHHGHHYFSMKLVPGGSLDRLLRNGTPSPARVDAKRSREETPAEAGASQGSRSAFPLSLRSSAALVAVVARAVHYSHQRGVLHRDLKPGNILLDERGQPHVTDFGMAKILEEDSNLTCPGMVMGTPSYMSPEQAEGRNRELTTASDLWSLGTILYELISGHPAFLGATPMQTLRQVMDQDPKAPRTLNPAVDHDLETICLKCLDRDPARRYASAAALAEDLERWSRWEPILARRAGMVERAAKWARRQPLLAVAAIALSIVPASGLAGILWQWRQAGAARRAEAGERRRAERAETDALNRLQEAKLNFARANRLSGQPGQRFQSLAELAQAASRTNSLQLRNEAIACLALPDLRFLKQWAKTPNWDAFAFDADLKLYATNDASGHLTVRDAQTDELLIQLPAQAGRSIASCAAFSPNGRWVLAVDPAGQTRLWDGVDQTLRLLDRARGADFLLFTPDSRWLAAKFPDGSLHFLNPADGSVEKSLPVPAGLTRHECLLAPSGEVFLTRAHGQIVIRSLADGQPLARLYTPEGAGADFGAVKWHPNGRSVAAAWLNKIGHWDAETGRQIGVFEGHEGTVVGLAFTHEGQYLASAAWDGTTRLWLTDAHREVLSLPESGNALSLSADDRRLSFQTWDHRQVMLYELPDLGVLQHLALPPPKRQLVHHTPRAVFHPEGDLLLAPDHDGICVFHPTQSGPIAVLPVEETVSVGLSPQGDTLFTGGPMGAQRWPMRWSAERSELAIGPPEVLEPTRGLAVSAVDLSGDGRWLVAQAKTAVLGLQTGPPFTVIPFGQRISLARPPHISPDGRWVAMIPRSRSSVQIWNGRTGAVATNLPAVGAWQTSFSPEGRWLALSQLDTTVVWDTSDWSVRHRLAHPPVDVRHGLAFAPDGRVLATFASDWKIRLVDLGTLEPLAEFPAGRSTTGLCFNPSGDRLVTSHEAGYLHLWDLRHLHQELASLRLDWSVIPLAPNPSPRANRPPRVIVHPRPPEPPPPTGRE